MALSVSCVFRSIPSMIFAGLIILIVFVGMLLLNMLVLTKASHPIHGWLRHHPEEWDLSVPIADLRQLAAVDLRMHKKQSVC
jgi:hypothetical protein